MNLSLNRMYRALFFCWRKKLIHKPNNETHKHHRNELKHVVMDIRIDNKMDYTTCFWLIFVSGECHFSWTKPHLLGYLFPKAEKVNHFFPKFLIIHVVCRSKFVFDLGNIWSFCLNMRHSMNWLIVFIFLFLFFLDAD